MRRRVHVAGLALDAARARAGARAAACDAGRTSTSAAPASSRSALAKASGRPGGGRVHARAPRPRTAAPAVDRGRRGARPADRAHRRPPARAARGRRRADDRPDQALRRRGEVVLRGRHARGDARARCAGCARSPAAPYWTALDGRPGAGAPELRRCASRSCSTRRCRRRARCPAAPTAARGSRAGRPRPRAAAAVRAAAAHGRRRRPPRARRRRSAAALPAFAARAGLRRCSPIRCRARGAARRPIAHYDALLRDERLRRRAAARTWSCASATCRPPSRCARGSPASEDAEQVAFDPEGALAGPGRRRGDVARRRPARRSGRSLPGHAPRPTAWLDAWRARRRRRRGGDRRRCSATQLSEPASRPRSLAALPAEATAVRRLLDAGPRRRDVPARARRAPRVLSNRGANGIDGTRRRRVRRRRRRRRRRSCCTSATSRSRTTSARCCRAPRLGLDADDRRSSTTTAAGSSTSSPSRAARRLRGARRDADGPRRRAGRRPLRPAYERVDELGAIREAPGPCCTSARPRRERRPASSLARGRRRTARSLASRR